MSTYRGGRERSSKWIRTNNNSDLEQKLGNFGLERQLRLQRQTHMGVCLQRGIQALFRLFKGANRMSASKPSTSPVPSIRQCTSEQLARASKCSSLWPQDWRCSKCAPLRNSDACLQICKFITVWEMLHLNRERRWRSPCIARYCEAHPATRRTNTWFQHRYANLLEFRTSERGEGQC